MQAVDAAIDVRHQKRVFFMGEVLVAFTDLEVVLALEFSRDYVFEDITPVHNLAGFLWVVWYLAALFQVQTVGRLPLG